MNNNIKVKTFKKLNKNQATSIHGVLQHWPYNKSWAH